jgi:probable F420-dependent oxidoreductase
VTTAGNGTPTPDHPLPIRPFRFLAEPGEISDGTSVAAVARKAESIGYSTLVYPDHLVHPFGVVPLLATIAAATERLRIAAFVANNDLRHPAVLAQDFATLDVLSNGRLDVAIGAGWNRPEYDAIGLPFDPGPTRVARLAEAVTVLKGCFGEGPFSFRGEHYTITEHDGQPKPVQQPHPPILIGGGGRRVLELAAREADIVSLAPRMLRGGGPGRPRDPRSVTVAATEEKIGWLREAAGDRFASLELNVYPSLVPVTLTDHARREAAGHVADLYARTGVALSEDELLESPHVFIGSVEGLVTKIRETRVRLGISSFMVGDVDTLAPVVERLAGT